MSRENRTSEKILFDVLPQWRSLISNCLWGDTVNGLVEKMTWSPEQREWLLAMSQKEQGVYRQIGQLLATFGGGKYPPLFGMDILIDDNAEQFDDALIKLGAYGFTVIDPWAGQVGEEPHDAYVDRVLDKVDVYRSTLA